jgi:hypothetical protein
MYESQNFVFTPINLGATLPIMFAWHFFVVRFWLPFLSIESVCGMFLISPAIASASGEQFIDYSTSNLIQTMDSGNNFVIRSGEIKINQEW